jgi:hypothetical protein
MFSLSNEGSWPLYDVKPVCEVMRLDIPPPRSRHLGPTMVYLPESRAEILFPGHTMTIPCGRAIAVLAALLGPCAVFSSPQDNPSEVRLLNADEEFTSAAGNLAAFWVTGWRPFRRTTRLVLRLHGKRRYSRAKYVLGAPDSDTACGFLCVNNLLLEKLTPRSPPTPRRTSGEESAGSVSLSSCAYDP